MPRNGSRNVVIALGNRFRGDDGVGPAIAERLNGGGRFEVVEGALDALGILETWEDAALAVVVDATASGRTPGTVYRLEVGAEPFPKELGRCSSHGLGLAEAISLGKTMGKFPDRLVIYAIEAKAFEVGATLSDEVTAAAEKVVRRIEAEFEASNHV